MKTLKFFEYAYLGVFVLSVIEIVRYWNHPDKQRFYIFLIFAVVSLGMFFFRRYYRKRFEKRNPNK
ncbi:NfeD family protein [Capnocytophaga canimorsus]|uniref:NfeD family protein n=1 Tax=Capnocytophaga canimorsus TaxID=28188 RepID=UPI0015624950|nr:NfeD family protein [Capnocytophaga canimorsus]